MQQTFNLCKKTGGKFCCIRLSLCLSLNSCSKCIPYTWVIPYMSVQSLSIKTPSHFYNHIPHVRSCSYIFWSWLLLNPNECSVTSQVPNKTEPSSRSAAKAELDEHISITPCSWASSPLIVLTARRKSRHLVNIFKIWFTELLHRFYHVMFCIHISTIYNTIIIFYHTPNATELS